MISKRTRVGLFAPLAVVLAAVGGLLIGFISSLAPFHGKMFLYASTTFAASLALWVPHLTAPVLLVAACPIAIALLKPKVWWASLLGYGLLVIYWFFLVYLANNAPWD
jgi:hypothetical protein